MYLTLSQQWFRQSGGAVLDLSWESLHLTSLRPRQNGRHFADDIFKCIFLNENAWISLKISLKFFPKVPIDNIPALVQIMAWRRPGDKPLSEPMMVSLLTHICVTGLQWVKSRFYIEIGPSFLYSVFSSVTWKAPLSHKFTLAFFVFTFFVVVITINSLFPEPR